MFFAVNDIDIASYTDDNTPYMIIDNNGLFEWFKNNILQSNADKCHLLVSTNDRVRINVDGFKIDYSDTLKLLGVTFDGKLTFDDHISGICKKAGRESLFWPE